MQLLLRFYNWCAKVYIIIEKYKRRSKKKKAASLPVVSQARSAPSKNRNHEKTITHLFLILVCCPWWIGCIERKKWEASHGAGIPRHLPHPENYVNAIFKFSRVEWSACQKQCEAPATQQLTASCNCAAGMEYTMRVECLDMTSMFRFYNIIIRSQYRHCWVSSSTFTVNEHHPAFILPQIKWLYL